MITKFRKIEKREPGWLYNLRKNSWHQFNDMPLPDRVKHLWKYTDPKQFLNDISEEMMQFPPPAIDSETESEGLLQKDYAAYGYNRDDLSTVALLDPALAGEGVVFMDLRAAVEKHEDIIGNNLGHLIGADFGKFEAINLALWNSGLFIYIPDNMVIEKPIRLYRHPGYKETFHRLLIIAGENSQATIVDEYTADKNESRVSINSAVEIFAGRAANIRFANLQRMPDYSTIYITQRSRLADDAQMTAIYGGLGGRLAKVNAGAILDGRGAHSRMTGVVFADHKQHFDYHTRHHHRRSESYSNIDFKVVLKDKARSAYTGLIKINEDALNCQAFQENRNLLLNQGPRAESIPELEILCDQVQCSHGATMGPIDPEMVFYLASRGYSYDEAVKTIVTGFVEPTVEQLPENLKEVVRASILHKLEE